ncbi:uncharacterized protein Tco025E_00099 [Trypanosoma conorhini]|uniref:Uncharacterized protein n=1 Tax=Trypanosoma conorhini TaxID=83891 RepID=A0A422QCQ7_9TRYP|nr:uncharacterized protein Tco025E_00099 [Trypanosoma conorhini]RNF27715.1 hypothetical protein Tco025E_00099 [Trypanosoma conorhini]
MCRAGPHSTAAPGRSVPPSDCGPFRACLHAPSALPLLPRSPRREAERVGGKKEGGKKEKKRGCVGDSSPAAGKARRGPHRGRVRHHPAQVKSGHTRNELFLITTRMTYKNNEATRERTKRRKLQRTKDLKTKKKKN